MKPIDLKDLIKGLIGILLIAIALGYRHEVERLAQTEFTKTARVCKGKAFFPEHYTVPAR